MTRARIEYARKGGGGKGNGGKGNGGGAGSGGGGGKGSSSSGGGKGGGGGSSSSGRGSSSSSSSGKGSSNAGKGSSNAGRNNTMKAGQGSSNAGRGSSNSPRYGVGKQNAAQNHYNTQNSIRDYADQQHGKGLKIGDQSIGDHFNRDLSQAEQDYLFNYAGSKGYGFGDAFGSRYAGQTAQDPGDPMRPYKPGSYRAAMVDGGIGHGEIKNKVKQRAEGKDNFNRNNAYLRIADRWSLKDGAALRMGALKNFNSKYEKKNPFLASWNKAGVDGLTANYGGNGGRVGFGNWSNFLEGKAKSQHDLYRAGYDMLSGKAFQKGDVFARLQDGTLRAQTPVADTNYMNQFNGGFGEIGLNGGGTGGLDDGYYEEPFIEEPEEKMEESGMMGGGNSGVGANALGIKRKKSSWAESRRNAGGTGNLARSNFSMGINTGLK